jgi:hypothetical protein
MRRGFRGLRESRGWIGYRMHSELGRGTRLQIDNDYELRISQMSQSKEEP